MKTLKLDDWKMKETKLCEIVFADVMALVANLGERTKAQHRNIIWSSGKKN